MISPESEIKLAEYVKQGWEPHAQFTMKNGKPCIQVMAVSQDETSEDGVKCVLIEEISGEDGLVTPALEIMGITLNSCGNYSTMKEETR